MHSTRLAIIAVTGLLLAVPPALSAATNGIMDELKEIITNVDKKLKEGKNAEKDLGAELKAIDDLLARHKGERTDEVAQILLVKAMIHLEVLNDTGKGAEIIKQLKTEFPETGPGKNADMILASIARQVEAKKIQAALVEGAKFPDFNESDLAGKPLSIASYKGKVVLIDFWATWCGPCLAELPNVLETFEKYHGQGFEIIGVSLDDSREKLDTFVKQKKMTWPQFFDGRRWDNKLATQYGILSIPATYLLDGEGKIIGKDLRGDELGKAVAAALAKK